MNDDCLQREHLEYEDVAIGPLEAGSSKHRLVIAAGMQGVALPHCRLRDPKNRIFNDISNVRFDERLNAGPLVNIAGNTLYDGVYFRHFGHFVAESTHRLYALKERDGYGDAMVAFHASGGRPNIIEPWLEPVLAICGVAMERVCFIDRPTRFERLLVPPQARVLGGATLRKNHASQFPNHASSTDRPIEGLTIYVGRSGHLHSGGFAGERFLEGILEKAGICVVHPELMRLDDLVATLRRADSIIFAEGSAVHNLELCGKISPRVMIIGRRAAVETRFGYLARDYSREARFFDDCQVLGSIEWDNSLGRPHGPRAISVLNIHDLLSHISAFCRLELEKPGVAACEDAIMMDVGRYLLDPRSIRDRKQDIEKLGAMFATIRSRFSDWRMGRRVQS